jgi:hypothetical protein
VKHGANFVQIFKVLIKNVQQLNKIITEIECFAGGYDLDEETRGNGYRSFVYVHKAAVNRTLKMCTQVRENRESFFFRRSFYEK